MLLGVSDRTTLKLLFEPCARYTLGHNVENLKKKRTASDPWWPWKKPIESFFFYFCSHLYLTQFRAARRDQIRLGFENALEIWHFLSLSVHHLQNGSKINITFLARIFFWRENFRVSTTWIKPARGCAFRLVPEVMQLENATLSPILSLSAFPLVTFKLILSRAFSHSLELKINQLIKLSHTRALFTFLISAFTFFLFTSLTLIPTYI